jgi:hypothetical protein
VRCKKSVGAYCASFCEALQIFALNWQALRHTQTEKYLKITLPDNDHKAQA